MTIEIRPVAPDESRAFFTCVELSFGSGYHEADIEVDRRFYDHERLLAAVEDGRIVGTAGALSFQLTVPGASVPAAGVTLVGVSPSHRRQGILTRLMRRQIDDVHERGEPLAILWASEAAIYGRYGYGLTTISTSFEMDRVRAVFRLPVATTGRISVVGRDEALAAFPSVYDEIARRTPGFFTRTPSFWGDGVIADPEHRRGGAGPKFFVLLERDGRAEGYLIYRIQQEWDERGPRSVAIVRELMATTPDATARLWRWVFDLDLVGPVKAAHQAVDHPLLLLLTEPRRLGLMIGDGLFARLVDLPAALAGRTYAGDGELVLEVIDAFCPWNAGRWRLAAERDGEAFRGRAERTSEEADLAIGVEELGMLYLGGFTIGRLAAAGRVVELRPGAAAAAEALLRTPIAPWCPAVF